MDTILLSRGMWQRVTESTIEGFRNISPTAPATMWAVLMEVGQVSEITHQQIERNLKLTRATTSNYVMALCGLTGKGVKALDVPSPLVEEITHSSGPGSAKLVRLTNAGRATLDRIYRDAAHAAAVYQGIQGQKGGVTQ